MFYNLYKNGFLPDPGSVVDQSNHLLETLRIIDDENASADKALTEKAAAKSKSKAGKGRKR